MKYILFSLLVLSLVFASSSSAVNVEGTMKTLCSSTKSLLAGAAVLFLLGGAVVAAIGFVIRHFKKDRKTWKLAGTIILVVGILILAGGILGLIMYLLTPMILESLVTGGTSVSC